MAAFFVHSPILDRVCSLIDEGSSLHRVKFAASYIESWKRKINQRRREFRKNHSVERLEFFVILNLMHSFFP